MTQPIRGWLVLQDFDIPIGKILASRALGELETWRFSMKTVLIHIAALAVLSLGCAGQNISRHITQKYGPHMCEMQHVETADHKVVDQTVECTDAFAGGRMGMRIPGTGVSTMQDIAYANASFNNPDAVCHEEEILMSDNTRKVVQTCAPANARTMTQTPIRK